MINPARFTRLGLATIAAGMLLTNGCNLAHGERPTPYGEVSPANYCPGDVATVSYDLTRGRACIPRPDLACAAVSWPTTAIDSMPTSFTPATFTGPANSFNFSPTAPSVDVTFTPSPSPATYIYPTLGTGGVATFARRTVGAQTRSLRRIDGSVVSNLSHNGMCNGASPTHAAAEVANLPAFSPNLRIQEICNTSDVAIVATLTSASGGVTRDLMPGACFTPNVPGMPALSAAGSTVSVRSLAVDPIARCNPVQGTTPPQPLTTRAILACSN